MIRFLFSPFLFDIMTLVESFQRFFSLKIYKLAFFCFCKSFMEIYFNCERNQGCLLLVYGRLFSCFYFFGRILTKVFAVKLSLGTFELFWPNQCPLMQSMR